MQALWEYIRDHWRNGVEILILAVCIYQIWRAFRATRGAQILVGLSVILVVLTMVSNLFDFQVLGWIIKSAAALLAFALLVIFQPELRNALARLGSSRMFSVLSFAKQRRQVFIERFADAVIAMSKKRIGAIFAIQRGISLKQHLDSGVLLDSRFSPELAMAVFFPKAPLHDGGMIIVDERVAGAACVFPVSQRELKDRSLGLRHRAAIGVTEEADCVAVVVSEETGGISICIDGELERNLGEKQFRDRLAEIFLPQTPHSDENSPNQELDRQNRVSPARDSDMVSD